MQGCQGGGDTQSQRRRSFLGDVTETGDKSRETPWSVTLSVRETPRPFDRVGVDVLQLPKTSTGNRYAVVFMDYLTKWPEGFATADQTAPTIAPLLVEEIISRHGVPSQLMSDRGPSSKLLLAVCSVMGIKKLNTTAYHPQLKRWPSQDFQ